MYICVVREMREMEYDRIIDVVDFETIEEANAFETSNTKGNIYVDIMDTNEWRR